MTRHKYKAEPTMRDGILFDSKKEAGRYGELVAAQRAGIIRDLQIHVPFQLDVCGEQIGRYIADFVYHDREGRLVVEDTKGVRTEMYKWKKRHMLAQYDIRIVET